MNSTDYAVIAVLFLIAAFPLLPALVKGVSQLTKPASQTSPTKQWQHQWVQTLISLQQELETRPDQPEAVKLCRQLIWQILGGGPTQ